MIFILVILPAILIAIWFGKATGWMCPVTRTRTCPRCEKCLITHDERICNSCVLAGYAYHVEEPLKTFDEGSILKDIENLLQLSKAFSRSLPHSTFLYYEKCHNFPIRKVQKYLEEEYKKEQEELAIKYFPCFCKKSYTGKAGDISEVIDQLCDRCIKLEELDKVKVNNGNE